MRNLFLFYMLVPLCGCNALSKLYDHQGNTKFGGQSTKELVILVAGQSNAVSDISNVEPSPPLVYSVTGRVTVVHAFHYEESNGIPTQAKPLRHSAAWIHLGDMIVTQTGRSVKVVNISHGGTSTREYLVWKEEMQNTIATLKPDFVLWVQGESDTMQGIPTEESYSNMKQIIGDTYKQAHWFIALDGYCPTDMSGIRETQRRLIAEGIATQGPDIDRMRGMHREWFDYDALPVRAGGGAEFANDGLLEHAKAWLIILNPYL